MLLRLRSSFKNYDHIDKDWLSGLYSRNNPDGCLYGDNHLFSLSEGLYGQGTLCELV